MKYSKSLYLDHWNTGSGKNILFDNIVADIREHTLNNGKVYIGADSQIHAASCTFVTAICLHGGDRQAARYYFKKEKRTRDQLQTLRTRINEEVSKAVDAFLYLSETIPGIDVEIHIDIGSTERSKTSVMVESVTGWLKGLGVTCKIKPEAWASASVADKHTK